jgi:hypothetical protein
MFQFVTGDSDLERVDVIIDLGVLVDNRMTFVDHIESIVSRSARMLGFIKRILREFIDSYSCIRRCMWLLSSSVWRFINEN